MRCGGRRDRTRRSASSTLNGLVVVSMSSCDQFVLTAASMISAALSNSKESWSELASVSKWAEQALLLDKQIAQMAQRYRYINQCVVLGRGFNYATAFEWALKLKELTYLIAEPYSSADFQHAAH